MKTRAFAVCALTICAGVSFGQFIDDRCVEGNLVSAATEAPVDSAAVSVQWVQVTKRSRDYDLLPVSRTAVVSGSHYRACGIPVNAPVRISVARDGYRDLEGDIVMPTAAGAKRDFRLVADRLKQGTGILSGRVLASDGRPLTSGYVVIRGLDQQARIIEGNFGFENIPDGSWAVEARAIGYTPGGVIIDVSRGGGTTADIVLAERTQVLQGMTITAFSKRDVESVNYVLARQRVGFGTFVLPGDPRLERALNLSDVLKTAPGFHQRSNDTLEARAVGSGRCVPTIYVDGMRNAPYVQIQDVLAVAAYPDMTGVPVDYRDPRNCAVILVLMKR